MIKQEIVVSVLHDSVNESLKSTMRICDHYGQRREEIFGYIISFREFLSMESLDKVMRFFVFLVRCFESETGRKLFPSCDVIQMENKRVTDKVQYILTSETSSIHRVNELWKDNVVEENLYAYGIHEIIKQYDMGTEEGIQMYIAIISLIEIFSKTSKLESGSQGILTPSSHTTTHTAP